MWPEGMVRDPSSGVLTLRGHPVTELAERHGTPTQLLDERDFRARARAFRVAFADADVYYAAKAFLCRGLARWVAEEGLNLDVSSGGELAVALSGGFPAERIALHGNNKSVAELQLAIDSGVGRIVLDSSQEIGRLADLAARAGIRARVLIRVTVGVEAHTHEFIATAHEDVKFGFSLSSGDALGAVADVLARPSLELVGLHSHIGSQIFDTSGFEVAAHRMVGLLAEIRDAHQVELAELDLGGGLGIAYVPSDDPEPVAEVAQRLADLVRGECSRVSLAVPRLAVEPGRALVGPAGTTLYEVGTVKDVDGLRRYVSVDGGMSDNIRTALYAADYTVTLANRASIADPVLCRVVGKHCESGDVVVRDAWLPADLVPGDLIAVAATGAYCRSMASNYNFLPRPPVIAVDDTGTRELLRRETLEDLLACDVG